MNLAKGQNTNMVGYRCKITSRFSNISMPRDGVRSGKLVGGTRVLVKQFGSCGRSHRLMAAREDGTLGRYHRACFAAEEMSIGYGGTAAKYYYLLNFYKDLSKIQNRITLHLDSLKESSTGDNSP
jgi:hypothetical protein